MQESNRKKRPPVRRTEPDRSFSGWVRGGTPTEKASRQEDHPADREPPASAEQGDSSNARESGYQAINGAYRLIDEYMRQGQKVAEDLWLPSDTSERNATAFEAPMRFMRAMGDMTMAWVEVVQQWTSNQVEAQAPGPAGPFTAGRPPAAPAPAAPTPPRQADRAQSLRVSVKAAGPIEVSVDVASGVEVANVVPGELRTFDGDPPPIRGVKVEPGAAGEGPVLCIVVPEGQPPGTYNGLLVTRGTQRPCGTISLVVA